jgi:multiple inositol-polyphosphate phosphatase/2,3-bisphosphoglycerate 3-phosphatase
VTNATVRQWLQHWRNPFPSATAGLLVDMGLEEHYGLGIRFDALYGSTIGSGPYNPLNTTFQNTKVERTAMSSQSFGAGLYNQHGPLPNRASPIYSFNLPEHQDPTLRPFNMCPRFQKAFLEAQANEQVQLWQRIWLPDISSRLSNLFGVGVNHSLAKTMWEACAFEFAVLDEPGRFCSLFNDLDFKVFEYAEDLQEYYTRSYGLPIAWQIAAPLLNELVSTMESKLSALSSTNPSSPASFATSFFRFAHAETMEPLITILGLYNDSKPLSAEWFWPEIDARQFKSSQLFPFASNLAMFGYDCGSAHGLPERYYIKFQHNERDVVIPACTTSTPTLAPFCGFDEFRSAFSAKLAIDFNQLCTLSSPPTTPVTGAEGAKFHAIYAWGPAVLMAAIFLSFIAGCCVGTRRPLYRRKEPLLSSADYNYQ